MLLGSPVSPGGVVSSGSVTSAQYLPSSIQTQPDVIPVSGQREETFKRFYHVYTERRGSHTALAGAKPGPSLWSGICLALPGPPPPPLQHCRWHHHRYRGYLTTQTNGTELIETERNHKKVEQYNNIINDN